MKEEAPELSPRRASSAPVLSSMMSSLANSPDLLAESPTLHSDLGAHFDVYDEHLDKKKEQLYGHLGLAHGVVYPVRPNTPSPVPTRVRMP